MTLLVASAARPVSAERGPLPWDCVADGTCCFVTKPAAVPFKPPVIDVSFDGVRLGDTGLERTQVRRALRRQAGPLEACFHRDSGSADVVLVIGPEGGAHATSSTGSNPRIARCIARTVTHMVFPVSDEVTEVSVTISGVRR